MVSFTTLSGANLKYYTGWKTYFWYTAFFIEYVHTLSQDFPPKGLASQPLIMDIR